MHVRTGLKNEYLSDSFMELVRCCVKKAKSDNMLAWLYDENRWPSGAAGGLVTKNEEFRGRCLMLTTDMQRQAEEAADFSRAEGTRSGNSRFVACYDVELDENAYLKAYKKIDKNERACGTKWYATLEIQQPNPWYNNQTYIDMLNHKAIDRFIEVTHERYRQAIGDEFDGVVPAIFTDEPQFTRKGTLNNSTDKNDVTLPWTDDVTKLYREAYGDDILESIPELF